YRWSDKKKCEWLHRAADQIEANPVNWPISTFRRPDVIAGIILTYLGNGRAQLREISAALGIRLNTCKSTLSYMERAGWVTHSAHGIYALPGEGVIRYVRTPEAILAVLADGPSTPVKLRAVTGKSRGQIAGALTRLKKAGKIVLTRRAEYAL